MERATDALTRVVPFSRPYTPSRQRAVRMAGRLALRKDLSSRMKLALIRKLLNWVGGAGLLVRP